MSFADGIDARGDSDTPGSDTPGSDTPGHDVDSDSDASDSHCPRGYGDCDENPDNGCETKLDSLEHCGGCGSVCAPANATAQCTGGVCAIEQCTQDFVDCDGQIANGCEYNRSVSPDLCCGGTCGPAGICSEDRCDSVVRVSTQADHSCALRAGGGVVCWGDNTFGQLGNGTFVASRTPVAVSGIHDALDVSVGYYFSCAVRVGGELWCWGRNAVRELGQGAEMLRSPLPIKVPIEATITSVSAGAHHACALEEGPSGGAVWCWGGNVNGMTGNGVSSAAREPSRLDELLEQAGSAKKVRSGIRQSCAIMADERVFCWGDNLARQLSESGQVSDIYPPILKESRALDIAPFHEHTCVIVEPGELVCRGKNSGFQSSAQNLAGVVEVATGLDHTCARTLEGKVFCWGHNGFHVLGAPAPAQIGDPLEIDLGGVAATQIDSGLFQVCAALENGKVACWGNNASGQLGNGESSVSLVALEVELGAVHELRAGEKHMCARHGEPRQFACWGLNDFGQLGDGSFDSRAKPEGVLWPEDVAPADYALGQLHTCAVAVTGKTYCWGRNNSAQLGRTEATAALIGDPDPVPALADVPSALSELSAGNGHSCALDAGKNVVCWGHNNEGQLGRETTNVIAGHGLLSGLGPMSSLSAGNMHGCAIHDQKVYCWGRNSQGQLGDGTELSRSAPAEVALPASASQVVAGLDFSCALVESSAPNVYCWGQNSQGQLGAGSESPAIRSLAPLPVVLATSATDLTAGRQHACALLTGGTVSCWGLNNYGQLGAGNLGFVRSPVAVVGVSNAVSIAATAESSCALDNTQRASCWGHNAHGQLGSSAVGVLPPKPVTVRNLPRQD
ncbi:MAG: hypothetical protein H0U74_05425 [Bradymonadaceae bacterium]|nr:hypothetical protein [Lujinxingiaceae bacterium]